MKKLFVMLGLLFVSFTSFAMVGSGMVRIVCENPETGDLVTKDIHAGTNAQAACPVYAVSSIEEIPDEESMFFPNWYRITCTDPESEHEIIKTVPSSNNLELICPRYELISVDHLPMIDAPNR